MSDHIDDALLEVQRELKAITANAENPYFQSKYATLEDVHDHVKPVLNKHDIYVSQPTIVIASDNGKLVDVLRTVLHHVPSATSKISECLMPYTADVQKWGGALTFMKRYQLLAMLFIPTADDDGNEGSKPDKPKVYVGNAEQMYMLGQCCKKEGITEKDEIRKIHKSILTSNVEANENSITKFIQGWKA
jgi:hypothetical protein